MQFFIFQFVTMNLLFFCQFSFIVFCFDLGRSNLLLIVLQFIMALPDHCFHFLIFKFNNFSQFSEFIFMKGFLIFLLSYFSEDTHAERVRL